jgi:putative SOS response-associated peptidase YedK
MVLFSVQRCLFCLVLVRVETLPLWKRHFVFPFLTGSLHWISGELVVSFSMLTVNADEHPVMRQFHKPGDEKRTPVIIAPDLHDAWLGAEPAKAAELITWAHMPELSAESAAKT